MRDAQDPQCVPREDQLDARHIGHTFKAGQYPILTGDKDRLRRQHPHPRVLLPESERLGQKSSENRSLSDRRCMSDRSLPRKGMAQVEV